MSFDNPNSEAVQALHFVAKALINTAPLTEREGQFIGGLAFRTAPLSEKQERWLRILVDRHGLDLEVPQ